MCGHILRLEPFFSPHYLAYARLELLIIWWQYLVQDAWNIKHVRDSLTRLTIPSDFLLCQKKGWSGCNNFNNRAVCVFLKKCDRYRDVDRNVLLGVCLNDCNTWTSTGVKKKKDNFSDIYICKLNDGVVLYWNFKNTFSFESSENLICFSSIFFLVLPFYLVSCICNRVV